jgi:DNA ligase (NAD+)
MMQDKDVQLLIKYANLYYNGYNTNIDDREYDRLYEKVKLKYPNFNLFEHIKYETDNIRGIHKHKFIQPLYKIQLSEIDDLSKYEGEYITPKYDGCSIRIYYENGKLSDILTRSDEYSGIVKTNALKNKVPQQVSPDIVYIDCEAMVSLEDFGENSRVKANGLINSKYKQEEIDKYIEIFPFFAYSNKKKDYKEIMTSLPFDKDKIIISETENELKRRIKKVKNSYYVSFDNKSYPVDGYVIYLKNIFYEYLILKQYFDLKVLTKVIDIEYNESNIGYYIPLLVIDPVIIDNTTITRVSIGTYNNLVNSKCGIGSKVEIVKSGKVIPKVEKVIRHSKIFKEPKCYHCNNKLIFMNNNLYCNNKNCIGLEHRIIYNFLRYYLEDHIEEFIDTSQYLNIQKFREILKSKQFTDFMKFMEYYYSDLLYPYYSLILIPLSRLTDRVLERISRETDHLIDEILKSKTKFISKDKLFNALKPALNTTQISELEITFDKYYEVLLTYYKGVKKWL